VDGELSPYAPAAGAQPAGGARAASSSGGGGGSRAVLAPVQVVEAVSELLLDDLLCEQALEVDAFCDGLANQLFDAEFE
jgi:hypothetical protein